MPQKNRFIFPSIKFNNYLCYANKNSVMKYLYRVADKILQERLETFGAVLIEGPKWTGKTTTAEQHAKSCIKIKTLIKQMNIWLQHLPNLLFS